MQYREKCFRNGNKLDKWRTYLVKSTGRNHYSNRHERKQFPCSLKRLKISCKCSNWSSRKVTAVFRHRNVFQNSDGSSWNHSILNSKGPSHWESGLNLNQGRLPVQIVLLSTVICCCTSTIAFLTWNHMEFPQQGSKCLLNRNFIQNSHTHPGGIWNTERVGHLNDFTFSYVSM